MDINEIAVFIKVIEMGSFSKAAQHLEMPNSTVSAKVSSLESRLGVTLIKRTTRKLAITSEGQIFFESCRNSLELLNNAEEQIKGRTGEPHGLLRVTAPVAFGAAILPPIIAYFNQKYPKVNLDLILSDRTVDLISENIDVAVRVGNLKDSTLIAKKLGFTSFALFASPKYLKTHETILTPKDLKQHCCLQFSPLGTETWKLVSPKNSVHVTMSKKIVVNELNTLKSLTLLDEGVALLPTFLCQQDIKTGKLVAVLTDYKANLSTVQLVYAAQKQASLKINAFVSTAGDMIRKSLS